jgi:O-antigen ligase
MDVFLAYIKEIGWSGHSGMGPIEENGKEYTHAHNSYLQVFYNFGIIAGVAFLAIYALSVWKSASIAISQGRKYTIYFVPFALIIAFGVISLTEWAFHPCIPAGFCFLLMQPILIKEA